MKAILRLALCAMCAIVAPQALAQGYPNKAVRMLVGFPPGGGTDILARIVAQKLSESWGQPVIVENRPGASATIAAQAVAQAAPDGYTLSMGQLTPNAIAPALMAKLPYATRDFVPIVLVGTSPNVLVVNPSVPAKDVAELVALAKSRPGRLTYASSGTGSLQHIAAETFKSMAGVDIVHVPFKGSGQAVIDLISGQVDMNFDSIPAVIQHVKSGKLRAIAVTARKRASGLPEVPAIAESGFPDYDLTTWWGLFAPAGTPPEVLAKIHRDTLAALQNADLKERFATLSVEPGGGSSRDFAAYVGEEIAKYDALVKRLAIKAE
ncbi:MAG TPA: tripartite tricarboxylate transporter substrate binding protein [Usitatibacter sp.]|nr:tripartite tricarboxylate transporter substrate binding protein [Usitatibacter sp.]